MFVLCKLVMSELNSARHSGMPAIVVHSASYPTLTIFACVPPVQIDIALGLLALHYAYLHLNSRCLRECISHAR